MEENERVGGGEGEGAGQGIEVGLELSGWGWGGEEGEGDERVGKGGGGGPGDARRMEEGGELWKGFEGWNRREKHRKTYLLHAISYQPGDELL